MTWRLSTNPLTILLGNNGCDGDSSLNGSASWLQLVLGQVCKYSLRQETVKPGKKCQLFVSLTVRQCSKKLKLVQAISLIYSCQEACALGLRIHDRTPFKDPQPDPQAGRQSRKGPMSLQEFDCFHILSICLLPGPGHSFFLAKLGDRFITADSLTSPCFKSKEH